MNFQPYYHFKQISGQQQVAPQNINSSKPDSSMFCLFFTESILVKGLCIYLMVILIVVLLNGKTWTALLDAKG